MDVVKNTYEKWDPKLSEVELHFRLLLLAVGIVIISVCLFCCYCYYEWGNRDETSSIDNAGVQEVREMEVLPTSDDETAGAFINLLSGFKDSTSDGNEDISIQSDSAENTSEVVVVIKSNTEDHGGATFTVENNSNSKDDKDDTSNTTNDSDSKTKSEDNVDKENTLIDKSKQCSSQENDCGKPSVEDNRSKTETASVTNVESENLETKNTTHL